MYGTAEERAAADGERAGAAGERAGAASARALDPALRLQHALDMAFRYLGPRARTEVELRRYLEGKRVEPATIEQALDSLREQGYLDDARFAREFSEDKRLLDEWGADRIERRLLALGVSAQIVRDAVGARGREDELEAALALLRRRFPALDADPREQRRAIGVLVRKGYDSELAWDVVRAHARGGEFD
jgi:regulatory protein